MFYEFPNDSNCWNVSDQYMFGQDILVAPIFDKGVVKREVYLPSGLSWKNAYTGEIVKGGQTVNVDAPIDVIPVFVREGKDYPIYVNE
jgi:alpha-D-xyloside xylohydrolase